MSPIPSSRPPTLWWERVERLLASALEQVGVEAARARELARVAHERYIDGRSGWVLYDDSRPVLARLLDRGWRHVILSNHVPELEEIVACLGLEDVVDAVVTSTATGSRSRILRRSPQAGARRASQRGCGSEVLPFARAGRKYLTVFKDRTNRLCAGVNHFSAPLLASGR